MERSQWKEGEGGDDEDDVDQGKRGATWKMLKKSRIERLHIKKELIVDEL